MIGRLKDATINVMASLSKNSAENNSNSKTVKWEKPEKYLYARPYFLDLDLDEVNCSRDFALRPIVKPRDVKKVPLSAGYAECINGGKSDTNEDNCYACELQLKSKPIINGENKTSPPVSPSKHLDMEQSMVEMASNKMGACMNGLYFGLFDGHAGYHTSLVVSRLLHSHLQDKLRDCLDLIIQKSCEDTPSQYDEFSNVSIDDLVVGAIEEAFQEMDSQLLSESESYDIKGGCTALVVLFLNKKIYIANAGDSRAVLCHGDKVIQMSTDFNPVCERKRINNVGHRNPELLHDEFSCIEFSRRLTKHDIGKVVLCRKPGYDGWSYKTVTNDDLKFPLVTGVGKKARLMATIGVTRGLGDHDLFVYDSKIWIKPFLTCQPEVRVIDLEKESWTENDVLILGSDGLWDVTTNQEAADIVNEEFKDCGKTDSTKYTIAAQSLIGSARGEFTGQGWKRKQGNIASFDDISVFVIPLKTYLNQLPEGKFLDSGVT
ncbi:Protein phosphatase 1H [Mactra antiquata]